MCSATVLTIPTREEEENAANDIACYSSQNCKKLDCHISYQAYEMGSEQQ